MSRYVPYPDTILICFDNVILYAQFIKQIHSSLSMTSRQQFRDVMTFWSIGERALIGVNQCEVAHLSAAAFRV